MWSAIAITAANPVQAEAYQNELSRLQRSGIISKETIFLAVPDPCSERIGSGGATLNALLTVTEYLSARAGLSYIDPETLETSKVLIIHSGGDSRRIPTCSVCGKAFSSLPSKLSNGELASPFLLLLEKLTEISQSTHAGLFVASGDVLLHIPEGTHTWNKEGVTGVAIPAAVEYGPKHGVYKLQESGFAVETFLQKPSIETLHSSGAVSADGTVLVDSGIVYFGSTTAKKILALNVMPPLDACTYLGVDNGAIPLRIELYSDILLSMAEKTNKQEFMEMESSARDWDALQKARALIWDNLRTLPFDAIVVESGKFSHLGTTKEYIEGFGHDRELQKLFHFDKHVQSYIEDPAIAPNTCVINSLLFSPGKAHPGSVIEHSELRGNWEIEEGAFCSGIRSYYGLHIEKNIVIKEIQLQPTPERPVRRVVTINGVFDKIKDHYLHPDSTFVNRKWDTFFAISGITPEELWPAIPDGQRSLWNAHLFPVHDDSEWIDSVLWLQYEKKPSISVLRKWKGTQRLSFSDILSEANPLDEFTWMQSISHKMDLFQIEETLLERKNHFLLPILANCAREKRYDVLDTLDSIAADSSPDITARTFSTVADALAAFAENKGGLRSGPMRNVSWAEGFELLDQEHYSEAVKKLCNERQTWLKSPDRLIRAARHYEGAAQVLIRKSVQTAAIEYTTREAAPIDQWITADLPARIDLAGGWSDTPPITYEHGGTVTNMAVNLDGQCPIGTRVRRTTDGCLQFQIGKNNPKIICRDINDLLDYAQPLAPAALCKAVLIVADVITLDETRPLFKQLESVGGGLEIETWTNLPTGSGLGTSSILAAGILAAVGKAIGREYDLTSILHAVLHIEQVLTTGGGWQDQVGGIIPGIKMASSKKGLPLTVEYETIPVSDTMIKQIENHTLLIYTGRTRLARNLLQDVIRRWYARYPEMVNLMQDLTDNAETVKQALLQEDLEGVGRGLTAYWEQKKQMARGAEPYHVTRMIEKIKPLTYGHSLTGAGGGGFMAIIVKDARQKEDIQSILKKIANGMLISFHDITINSIGLALR